MIGANCEGCAFFSPAPWANAGESGVLGQCRRHAPTFHVIGDKPRTIWPHVRSTDFCGEHAVMNGEGEGA